MLSALALKSLGWYHLKKKNVFRKKYFVLTEAAFILSKIKQKLYYYLLCIISYYYYKLK